MNSLRRYLFRQLLPYSMSRHTRVVFTLILALIVGFIWYCEKKEVVPLSLKLTPEAAYAAEKLRPYKPEPKPPQRPPVRVSLTLKDKIGARALVGGRIQWGEIRLNASVSGIPPNSSPLYQFALTVLTPSGRQDLATSGDYSSTPSWTWKHERNPIPGWTIEARVTVKVNVSGATIFAKAKAGPYLVVDDEGARRIFSTGIGPVMMHPRCLNCHVSGNSPTQGDDRHLHAPAVNRDTVCTDCHGTSNGTTPGSPPGALGWRLPPATFSFVNQSTDQLCRRLKDPSQTGGRSLEQVDKHVQSDRIIFWAFEPGPGRTRPLSIRWEDFIRTFSAWVRYGAACPEPGERSRQHRPR